MVSQLYDDLPKIQGAGICRLKPQLVHCMVHRAEQRLLYQRNLNGKRREGFQILKGKTTQSHKAETRAII